MERTRVLVMAGGRSERMRASGASSHKALARVHGTTLFEWNVQTALRYGYGDIVAAVSAREPEVVAHVRQIAADISRTNGAALSLFIEEEPLGNVGAAREAIGDASSVLMLYVDNMAGIDLRELVDFHRRGGYSVTWATHVHPFQIPFGELTLSGNSITAYAEKPTYRIQVSSGTCVISKRACELLPKSRPTNASALFELVSESGEKVGAFPHDEPWIDINDVPALQLAHSLRFP